MIRRTRLVALPAVALAIAGCGIPSPRIESHTAGQQDVIGPVRVTASLCSPVLPPVIGGPPVRGAVTLPECLAQETAGQFLVGFLVADDVETPETLTGTGVDATFTPDPVYAAHLEANLGAPDGERWAGYRSATVSTDDATKPTTVVQLDIPAAGEALHYGIETGYRIVDPGNGLAGDRTLNCAEMFNPGASPTPPPVPVSPFPTTVCQSPAPVDALLPLNQLTLRAPTGGAVVQGGSIALPFRAAYQGDADATFALAATTTLGDVAVAPELSPDADTTPEVPVTLTVPADAPLGPQQVTLTAKLGGQTRTATATVTIADKPKPATPSGPSAQSQDKPVAKLSQTLDPIASASMARVLRDGVPATYGCTAACDAVIDLLVYEPAAKRAGMSAANRKRYRALKTILVARRYSSLSGEGTKRETLKLSPLAKAGLRKLGNVTLVVRTTAIGRDGARTTALVRKLRLRKPSR